MLTGENLQDEKQLIQERFHLVYHRETQNRKGFALVVASGEPKLKMSQAEAGFGYIYKDHIRVQNRTLDDLAHMLQIPLNQPVVDQTGLKESYDFQLNFAPMDGTDSALPSIFAALEEQLGLKLEKANVPVETFVIEHVDRVPTEN